MDTMLHMYTYLIYFLTYKSGKWMSSGQDDHWLDHVKNKKQNYYDIQFNLSLKQWAPKKIQI